MMKIRLWHSYLSLITAPSIIFFALTGIVQIFSLHEARGTYHPPAFIEKMGRVHKDQVFALNPERAAPPAAAAEASPAPMAEHHHDDDDDQVAMIPVYLLKWFFTFVALSLTITAGLGLYIGLSNARRKKTGWALVAIGTIIPILLILI